jgi:hypothetical protein
LLPCRPTARHIRLKSLSTSLDHRQYCTHFHSQAHFVLSLPSQPDPSLRFGSTRGYCTHDHSRHTVALTSPTGAGAGEAHTFTSRTSCPTCLRGPSRPPGGESRTTIPTPDPHTSVAAALRTEIDQGAHQTPIANPPTRIAHVARAKLTSALKRQHGTAMATEGGGALQTTRALVAIHRRSLAVIPGLSSLLQKCLETGTR